MNAEIRSLKRALENRVGFELTSVQKCKELQQWLLRYQIHVSYSTLSRAFGFNQHGVTPRKATLDALARSLGFVDFHSFIKKDDISINGRRYQNDMLFQMETYLSVKDFRSATDVYLEAMAESDRNCFLSLHLGKELYAHHSMCEKELRRLASSSTGRKWFFQFYIDEDDLNNAFNASLKKHFLKNANAEEALFVRLYSLRKEMMKGNEAGQDVMDSLQNQVFSVGSIHLRARYWEIVLLNTFIKFGVVKDVVLEEILKEALSILNIPSFGGDECALVGRISRAILFTRSEAIAFRNDAWLTACRRVVFGTFSDLEFQSAAQRFLQLGGDFLSNQQMIFHSDWPNAYFTSQLFLQEKKVILRNQRFYENQLSIHPRFLKNLVSHPH